MGGGERANGERKRMKARWVIVLVGCLTWIGASEPTDPRSRVLLRRDCLSDNGRADVTLFANGTIRLREGDAPERDMRLGELPLEVLQTYVNRLEEIDLSETDAGPPDAELKWIGHCKIELGIGDGEPQVFQFGSIDSLPLALSRVITIVEELVVEVEERIPKGHLPRDYEPRSGDILVRADGARFKVIGYTTDKNGIELQGVDQPLTIYVQVEDMDEWFTELLSRQDFF
jgi:hypothetical protein